MNKDNTYGPNRDILQQKIIDACDGKLNQNEEKTLLSELKQYPDLYQDYQELRQLPDLKSAYTAPLSAYRNDFHIKRIHDTIGMEKKNQLISFDDVIVTWFKRYAIAAIFLILGTISLIQVNTQFLSSDADSLVPELVYSYEESIAESYIQYLEDLMENDD
jgi:hypothetical protein